MAIVSAHRWKLLKKQIEKIILHFHFSQKRPSKVKLCWQPTKLIPLCVKFLLYVSLSLFKTMTKCMKTLMKKCITHVPNRRVHPILCCKCTRMTRCTFHAGSRATECTFRIDRRRSRNCIGIRRAACSIPALDDSLCGTSAHHTDLLANLPITQTHENMNENHRHAHLRALAFAYPVNTWHRHCRRTCSATVSSVGEPRTPALIGIENVFEIFVWTRLSWHRKRTHLFFPFGHVAHGRDKINAEYRSKYNCEHSCLSIHFDRILLDKWIST